MHKNKNRSVPCGLIVGSLLAFSTHLVCANPLSDFIVDYRQARDSGKTSHDFGTVARGAKVVAGNEPWKVGGSNHGKSLVLPAGSTAISPVSCVGLAEPTVRFFGCSPFPTPSRTRRPHRGRREWHSRDARCALPSSRSMRIRSCPGSTPW